jgi:hypothetical protein
MDKMHVIRLKRKQQHVKGEHHGTSETKNTAINTVFETNELYGITSCQDSHAQLLENVTQ